MGYGLQIPAHQLGGPKRVWDFWGYGLSNAWVMRVSTVYSHAYSQGSKCEVDKKIDWKYLRESWLQMSSNRTSHRPSDLAMDGPSNLESTEVLSISSENKLSFVPLPL
jgi:hypothetical protein